MRSVSGFERPLVQWMFVALGALLVVVAAAEAIGLRRLSAEIRVMRAADLNARLEQDRVEATAARERSAREALSLEVSRLRGGTPSGASQPTLTLSPLARHGATPPDPTVERPPDHQSIQLRLLLPRGVATSAAAHTVVIRSWSGGDTLWSRSGLHATTVDGQAMVTAFITGDVLAPGAYEIALTAVSADNKTADVAAYEIAVRPAGTH